MYAVLAATTIGMIVSCFRWLIIDHLHRWTGVIPPVWDDTRLEERLPAFDYLVESHYRYYQFVANTVVALAGDKIIADASLHQTLGGWKRHIGRISVVVHPSMRGKGLAGNLVNELIDIARNVGLEKLEAEFLDTQKAARRVFQERGFNELLVLPEYVKDMQAISHDYVLMGRHIITDEEYTAAAG